MRRNNSPTVATESLVLGISVSSRTLHGVLVETTPNGPRLLRRLTRTRGETLLSSAVNANAFALADHDDGSDLLQIGEATGGMDMFLGNEFSGILGQPGSGATAPGRKGNNEVAEHDLFATEILDMLTEVRDALGQEPALAFVTATDDVTYALVHVADVLKEKPDRRRERLLTVLAEQVHEADAARTVFMPMLQTDDQVHALAVVPRVADPVTQSVARAVSHRRSIRPCLLDAELPLLIGLARLAPLAPSNYDDFYGSGSASGDGAGESGTVPVLTADGEMQLPEAPAPHPVLAGPTLVLRAGVEDTLALFLQDGQVQYFERMRSVTAFDAPETLCSRILLIQDEHGVGELSRVLLLGEQGEGDLIDAFSLFFPDANVGSIRNALPGLLADEALSVPETGPAMALAVALRLANTGIDVSVFPKINFLPSTLSRRQFVVPYTWHVYLLLGLIFATALFFVTRYYTISSEIAQQREAVRNVDPVSAEADVQQLQGRLDSLQSAQAQYAHALGVLDSLLMGSDRWSRALDLVSREASSVRGVWVENWTPTQTEITLTGNATTRDGVVAFAERTGGNLQSISFEEIRDFPTYAFTLSIPLSAELPEAVRYLRDLAAQQAGLNGPNGPNTAQTAQTAQATPQAAATTN